MRKVINLATGKVAWYTEKTPLHLAVLFSHARENGLETQLACFDPVLTEALPLPNGRGTESIWRIGDSEVTVYETAHTVSCGYWSARK